MHESPKSVRFSYESQRTKMLQFFNKKTEFDTVNSNYQFPPSSSRFPKSDCRREKKNQSECYREIRIAEKPTVSIPSRHWILADYPKS